MLSVPPNKTQDRICPRCGKEFSTDCRAVKYCSDCRDVHRAEALKERSRALREERKARGVCVRCGNQDERTLSGFTMCTMCAEKARVTQAKFCQRRKANGLCSTCGRPVDGGYTFCEACRNMMKDFNRARKEQKLCVGCGKSDDRTKAGKTLCEECAIKRSVYASNVYDQRTANRMCTMCGKALPPEWYFTCCPECIEIKRARQRTSARARKAAKDEGVQQGLH